MKKTTLVAVILLLMFTVGTAQADVKCVDTQIDKIQVRPDLADGTTASKFIIQVTCLDAGTSWSSGLQLQLLETVGDAGYATLLTAKSLGVNVELYAQSNKWGSLVTRVALQ